ncbi:GNAT family N-acetyltransferase [Alkalihalobacillus macyae]|uniref:GNAT family N-acetyltransferase n=1 Tax=Guptibacillus hwajinpoensis TaxID=208199 RepID=UPI00273ADDD2|nr:GNAT family N-acetyltransferase [Alkalihalobacillus macyae]MDP4552805.1 GNAT family N-acetyltransferase [Alkalihalobacillus macyae]
MKLEFKEINADNWVECVKLSVSADQKGFVADNSYSLLESKFTNGLYPLTIYNQDVMIGFLMYGVDPETNRMEMSRLMIDKDYQGRGYGKETINQFLKLIVNTYGKIELFTSAEPENINAIKLYESLGFMKTGEIMWGEVVLKIQL